jgi:hypothetical protein
MEYHNPYKENHKEKFEKALYETVLKARNDFKYILLCGCGRDKNTWIEKYKDNVIYRGTPRETFYGDDDYYCDDCKSYFQLYRLPYEKLFEFCIREGSGYKDAYNMCK